ncbi:hypothetical protein HKX48_007288, partial [Thoreauomyces humboldtii]
MPPRKQQKHHHKQQQQQQQPLLPTELVHLLQDRSQTIDKQRVLVDLSMWAQSPHQRTDFINALGKLQLLISGGRVAITNAEGFQWACLVLGNLDPPNAMEWFADLPKVVRHFQMDAIKASLLALALHCLDPIRIPGDLKKHPWKSALEDARPSPMMVVLHLLERRPDALRSFHVLVLQSPLMRPGNATRLPDSTLILLQHRVAAVVGYLLQTRPEYLIESLLDLVKAFREGTQDATFFDKAILSVVSEPILQYFASEQESFSAIVAFEFTCPSNSEPVGAHNPYLGSTVSEWLEVQSKNLTVDALVQAGLLAEVTSAKLETDVNIGQTVAISVQQVTRVVTSQLQLRLLNGQSLLPERSALDASHFASLAVDAFTRQSFDAANRCLVLAVLCARTRRAALDVLLYLLRHLPTSYVHVLLDTNATLRPMVGPNVLNAFIEEATAGPISITVVRNLAFFVEGTKNSETSSFDMAGRVERAARKLLDRAKSSDEKMAVAELMEAGKDLAAVSSVSGAPRLAGVEIVETLWDVREQSGAGVAALDRAVAGTAGGLSVVLDRVVGCPVQERASEESGKDVGEPKVLSMLEQYRNMRKIAAIPIKNEKTAKDAMDIDVVQTRNTTEIAAEDVLLFGCSLDNTEPSSLATALRTHLYRIPDVRIPSLFTSFSPSGVHDTTLWRV